MWEERARHIEMWAETRLYMRDMSLHMERTTTEAVEAMRNMPEDRAGVIRTWHEDSVAHRQELQRRLDRLGLGDSPSSG